MNIVIKRMKHYIRINQFFFISLPLRLMGGPAPRLYMLDGVAGPSIEMSENVSEQVSLKSLNPSVGIHIRFGTLVKLTLFPANYSLVQ